jgi:hypothetical protein
MFIPVRAVIYFHIEQQNNSEWVILQKRKAVSCQEQPCRRYCISWRKRRATDLRSPIPFR